jgi:hypothetical protein
MGPLCVDMNVCSESVLLLRDFSVLLRCPNWNNIMMLTAVCTTQECRLLGRVAVWVVRTNVSGERVASTFWVERISERLF